MYNTDADSTLNTGLEIEISWMSASSALNLVLRAIINKASDRAQNPSLTVIFEKSCNKFSFRLESDTASVFTASAKVIWAAATSSSRLILYFSRRTE